jgi:hypothetical protein
VDAAHADGAYGVFPNPLCARFAARQGALTFLPSLHVSPQLISLTSFALSLLLVFRTNARSARTLHGVLCWACGHERTASSLSPCTCLICAMHALYCQQSGSAFKASWCASPVALYRWPAQPREHTEVVLPTRWLSPAARCPCPSQT